MAKKSPPSKSIKAATQVKAKAKKAAPKPAKTKAKVTALPAKQGMWKILEQKQAHLKEMEQARSEGRNHQGPQDRAFHANPRDPRFTKFAGPRRKAG